MLERVAAIVPSWPGNSRQRQSKQWPSKAGFREKRSAAAPFRGRGAERRGDGAERSPPPSLLCRGRGSMLWENANWGRYTWIFCPSLYLCRHSMYLCRHSMYLCRHSMYLCRHSMYPRIVRATATEHRGLRNLRQGKHRRRRFSEKSAAPPPPPVEIGSRR